jgi:quercetin dioxygenase-like cupin family protein
MTAAVETRIDWGRSAEPGPVPGVTASTVHGAQLSAALYRLEPGAVVPEHAHENEEFGQVLAGTLTLHVAGSTDELAEGDAFLVPGDVPHGAAAGDGGCTLLECYAPPRVSKETR